MADDRRVAAVVSYTAGVGPYVSYLRVLTTRRGESGLGLEAQLQAVVRHVAGGSLLAEYVEVESGRKNDRPQLLAALAMHGPPGPILIIAELDRLARNVHFISGLMEGWHRLRRRRPAIREPAHDQYFGRCRRA